VHFEVIATGAEPSYPSSMGAKFFATESRSTTFCAFAEIRHGSCGRCWISTAAPLNREEGQDMIDYGLPAALFSIVAIGVTTLIGPNIGDVFQDMVNGLQQA
jgi:Flp pilus assembly pilin Flp